MDYIILRMYSLSLTTESVTFSIQFYITFINGFYNWGLQSMCWGSIQVLDKGHKNGGFL